MNKKPLSNYDTFSVIKDGDKVFGKSASAGKYGFFPISLFMESGYACRRWDETKSTPVGEAVGNIDYLRNLPSLLGLGRYLVDDLHNRRKLDPTNSYKFAAGGSAAKLDGSMGQCNWGWGTDFYLAIWKEGNYTYKAASLKPIPGKLNYHIPVASKSWMNHGVIDRTTLTLCSLISNDPQYRGGNGSVIASGNASADNLSMLGYAATSLSMENFEKYAAKRGKGWGAGWYWIETVTRILFEIIMGTRNCQSSFNSSKDANGLYQGGLGNGVSGMPAWDTFNNYYPVVPLSAGLDLADGVGISPYNIKNSAGAVVYTPNVPVFFGLCNPYGHLYLGKNRIVGVKQPDGSYAFFVAKSSLTEWKYSDTGNMLSVGGLGAVETASWTYISRINEEGLAGMPAECEGTSSTYYSDGCYRDTAVSGFRAPLGAGYACNGGNDGLACFAGYHAPSSATAYLSSPLCEVDGDFDPVPRVYN